MVFLDPPYGSGLACRQYRTAPTFLHEEIDGGKNVHRRLRAQEGVSLVFLDPEALISLRRCDWLREEALIAVESSRKEEIVPSGDEFSVLGERFCGSSRWTFLRFSSACRNVPQARKAEVRNDLPSIQDCTDVPARRD